MKIKVFTNFEEVKEIWLNFEKQACLYAFQTYEWLSHWYEIIGSQKDLSPYIVVVYNSNAMDEIILLLPLCIQKDGFIKKLVWLGGDITDYHGPLINKNFYSKDNIDIIKLMNRIQKLLPKVDIMVLDRQPERIENIINPFVNKKCFHYHTDAYALVPEKNWEYHYNNNVKKKIRKDTERQIRRLSENGKLEFVIAENNEIIAEITDIMIQQKIERYRITKVPNLFQSEYYSRFYHSMAQSYKSRLDPQDFQIHVSALKYNQSYITTHWGIFFRHRFYYLMPSFQMGEISKYSPGRILLIKLLELCFNNKIKTFDFTVGGEQYKQNWCNVELQLFDYYRIYNLKGFVLFHCYKLKKIIKKYNICIKQIRRLRTVFRYVSNKFKKVDY